MHVGVVDGADGLERDEAGEVDAGSDHAAQQGLANADGRPARIDAFDTQPAGRVQQVGIGQHLALGRIEMGRALTTVGRGEDHAVAQRRTHRRGDGVQVAALQHDVRQGGVEGIRSAERGDRLGITYQVLAHFMTFLGQVLTFASLPRGR